MGTQSPDSPKRGRRSEQQTNEMVLNSIFPGELMMKGAIESCSEAARCVGLWSAVNGSTPQKQVRVDVTLDDANSRNLNCC